MTSCVLSAWLLLGALPVQEPEKPAPKAQEEKPKAMPTFDQILERVYDEMEEPRDRQRRESALEMARRLQARLRDLEASKDKNKPENQKEMEKIRWQLEQLVDAPPWESETIAPIFLMDGRVDVRHNLDPLVSPSADDTLMHFRWGLGLRAQLSPEVRITALGVQTRTWFADHAELRQQDRFDLYSAYADFRLYSAGIPATLSIGRMPFRIGEGRMVGQDWWANYARSFDAAHVFNRSWLGEPLGSAYIDSGFTAGRPVSVPPGETNDKRLNRSDPDVTLLAAQANLHLEDETLIRLYFLRDANREATTPGDFGFGTRVVYSLGTAFRWDFLPAVELSGEGAYQWGQVAGGTHSAGAAQIAARLHSPADSQNPSRWFRRGLILEYNYASGDRNPADGRHGTFLTPYPSPHGLHGFADLVGWQNMEEYAARWQIALGGGAAKPAVAPDKKTDLTQVPKPNLLQQAIDDSYFEIGYHRYFLSRTRDAFYGARGEAVGRDVLGMSSRDIGSELDFRLAFGTLELGYARFFAGDFLETTGAQKSGSLFYVGLFRGF